MSIIKSYLPLFLQDSFPTSSILISLTKSPSQTPIKIGYVSLNLPLKNYPHIHQISHLQNPVII